jgi:hypothetical protein
VNRTETNPVGVLVLTDVPLPLPIDQIVTTGDLTVSPQELMLAGGGVAFENAADAARAYERQLWSDPEAARQAFHRARSVTFWNKDILIPVCHAPPQTGRAARTCLSRLDYRVAGPGRRPAVAWCDLAVCSDPESFLRERLGSLAAFSITPPIAEPEPQSGPPEPDPDSFAALTTIAGQDDLDIPFDVPPVGAGFRTRSEGR